MKDLIRLLSIMVVILMLAGCAPPNDEDGDIYMRSGKSVLRIEGKKADGIQVGDCVLYDARIDRLIEINVAECRGGGNDSAPKWIGVVISIEQ